MTSADVDPAHAAIVVMLMFATVASLGMTLINLRNGRSWLVRVLGQRVPGVVTNIEIVTGNDGEVLRRPIVAFTTGDGQALESTPVVYRRRLSLAKGAPVSVSYVRRNPKRIVLHGYDFRVREPVYALLGVVIAVTIAVWYFDF
jgi:hypothetical protein